MQQCTKQCAKQNTKGDNKHFDDLTQSDQEKVLAWIKANILPRKTPLLSRSSYGMKHILQYQIGIYLSNNQFKEAMLNCGFKPIKEQELNWRFCISKKSPAFHF